ncbi:hypothetical protein [Lunatibacter salilacus]|uniref:hypothetical protein n=1 Tax=Lunatibacter salilacus TaxID=2483804 RepID=UPI00131DC6A9|nr:hypothetical protein [Lunatibacter salilacus]
MNILPGICKYTLTSLFFLMVQSHSVLAQVVEESVEEYPLNPSPYRIVFYIVISFIVIAVVFKLLYKPRKKHNPQEPI